MALDALGAGLADGTIASAFVTVGEAEARARSAARIAAVVEDSPDLVWMFDGRGLIEYASPSVSTALGLRQDELIGRLWRAITHPDDVPMLRAALADAGPDEPRTPLLELRLRASDGTWRWVEGQATLRFRNGRAIAVEMTGRDVTRTRAAEERGRRLSSQLEALVAGAPDGIVMVDEHDRIAVINEQARSLLELAPRLDEMIGWSTERAGREPARDAGRRRRGDRAAGRDRAGRRAGALPLPRVPRRAPDGVRLRAAARPGGCGCSATSRSSS